MNIGNLKLKHGLILAPMAGYSDRAMRMVCKNFGAELSVTEMVSAKAVVFGDKKTFNLARIGADEGPVLCQIFGSEPDVMARAAAVLQKGYEMEGYTSPIGIDINMGCPVHKIFSNGEGSALMKNPDLIYKIVRAVKESIDIPCTVKIRAGVDESHINAVECALAAEAGGARMITVHGRTKTQLYGGKANREIIKKVKNSLHIPLVANGDIIDGESALAMLRDTGADGIMIGRGAVGNPFIFSEILAALENREYLSPTIENKKTTALSQLELAVIDKGENVAVRESRKQIAAYFKAFRGSAAFRAKINSANTFDEVKEALLLLE